ncbi:MAG: DNA-3-methyladenine glycosylase I [Anaerolineae bacterium]
MPDKPATDAGFLEAAARIIFMGGLNRQVVDRKWPGFREAFDDFEVERVADKSPADVDALAADTRVIRYRAKLQAVVDNAARMRELADAKGSFRAYVDEQYASGWPAAARTLASEFRYVSEAGARHWLYSTGYDVGEVSDKIRRKYSPYEA